MSKLKSSQMNDKKITLLAINDKIVKEIKESYETRAQKDDLLFELGRKYKSAVNSGNIVLANDIYKQIDTLKAKIRDIENQTELSRYYMNAHGYIKEYRESDQKATVSNKFIHECLGSVYNKETEGKLMCELCGIFRVISHKEALAICESCGSIVEYQDSEICNEFSEEVEVLTQFSYKPINHFKEWISKILARESSNVTDALINALFLELKKDRITDPDAVTRIRIKRYLKALKYNKLYEDIPAILYKLCGREPHKISKDLELKLINMFEQIQEPFERHKPPTRTNFLSYSYVISKFCELLNEVELLEGLTHLKSREKLYEQDKIFKLICKDLGWRFIPSV